MTFSDRETSSDSGAPIELYLFELGTDQFAYTNRESDITFEGVDYIATPVSRGKLVSTIDNKDSQVNVSLPGDNLFARLYIGVIPGEFPSLTIRQLHTDDPDSEAIFVFQGFVSTIGFINDAHKAVAACRPITSATGRTVPRQTFQGLCNHTLYDPRCTQDEAAFEEFVQVESVDNRTVTIAAGELSQETAGYWLAGFIQFGNEYRSIVGQSTRVMTVDIPFREDPTTIDVRILPGCDHLIEGDCQNTYQAAGEPAPDGNTIHHSGFPWVPQKNPFDGLD